MAELLRGVGYLKHRHIARRDREEHAVEGGHLLHRREVDVLAEPGQHEAYILGGMYVEHRRKPQLLSGHKVGGVLLGGLTVREVGGFDGLRLLEGVPQQE
jgi:hypothetical protein